MKRKNLKALSDGELAKVQRRMDLIAEHMPDLVDEIRFMVKEEMLDSWRSIIRVEIYSTGEVA
jgi:hypothetical protein